MYDVREHVGIVCAIILLYDIRYKAPVFPQFLMYNATNRGLDLCKI